MEDGAFRGWGRDGGDLGKDLRGREFLNWDFLVWDEGFKWWVLKGREGGPVFFFKSLTMEGFLGEFEEGVWDGGMRWGCVALLNCEEGVVYVIRGGAWEEKVGGVRWGEEGDVCIGILDCLI